MPARFPLKAAAQKQHFFIPLAPFQGPKGIENHYWFVLAGVASTNGRRLLSRHCGHHSGGLQKAFALAHGEFASFPSLSRGLAHCAAPDPTWFTDSQTNTWHSSALMTDSLRPSLKHPLLKRCSVRFKWTDIAPFPGVRLGSRMRTTKSPSSLSTLTQTVGVGRPYR